MSDDRTVGFLLPRSARAQAALKRVRALQERWGALLRDLSPDGDLDRQQWRRDGGAHGGGDRLSNAGDEQLDRASVNVSTVHYDDEPDRALGSATALSVIVHPRNPRAPSIHHHVSLTELRSGVCTWRIMADLNPSCPEPSDRDELLRAWAEASPATIDEARAQGDRYFFIPALGRHRGVAHAYLEAVPDGPGAEALAERVSVAIIDAYGRIASRRMAELPAPGERDLQLAYHTLYLFQVLTLDRGTTAGLLAHDQNDLGILGSLPSRVDPDLLASWRARTPDVQRPWLDAIVRILCDGRVDDAEKRALAEASRAHYRANPHALAAQAVSDRLASAAENHRERRPGVGLPGPSNG
jgi:coproporphyrinogen III oxidase